MIQPDNEIVDAHMAWANRLIAQVRLEESCGEILEQLVAISELLNSTEDMASDLSGGIPSSFLKAHRQCLEKMQLITRGLVSLLEAGADGEELITRARTFESFLKNIWIIWHADVSQDNIEALNQKIFHGAA